MRLSFNPFAIATCFWHSLLFSLMGLTAMFTSTSQASVFELAREPFANIINMSYQRPKVALTQIEERLLEIDNESNLLTLRLLAAQLNLDFEQIEAATVHINELEGRVDPWLNPEHYVQLTFQKIRLNLQLRRELEALISLQHLLIYLGKNQSKKHLSETYFYLGEVMSALDLIQEAEQYYKFAETHFSQSGNRDLLLAIYRRSSHLMAETKNYEQSKTFLIKAEKVITFSRISTELGLLMQRACLGLHLGQIEEVEEAIVKLLARYEASTDPLVKRLVDKGLAKINFRRENYSRAVTFQQRYLRGFNSKDAHYFSGLEFMGLIKAYQGKKEESRELIEEARNYFDNPAEKKALRNLPIARLALQVYSNQLMEAQEAEQINAILLEQIKMLEDAKSTQSANAAKIIQALFTELEKRHQIELVNRNNIKQQLMQSKDAMEYQIFIVLVFALVLLLAFVFLWRSTIIKRDQKILRLAGELDEMSVRDSLTMLHNRRYFKNTADTLIANCQRRFEKAENNESFLGFILLDIDHLARLNQYYSHELGDYVLKQVAEDLREDCREGDILIRWGGEEFLILVNDTNFERLQKFCRRILNERNQKELKFQETKHQVTCSMGYVIFPFDGELNTQFTWEEIIKIAEQCLRIAKSEGRNRAYGLEALAMSAEAKYLLFTDFDACVDQQYVKLHKMEGTIAL